MRAKGLCVTCGTQLRSFSHSTACASRGASDRTFRTYLNLMLTMLLGGLWHGANWAFLVWGGLHGTFLIAHRLWAATPLATWLNAREGFVRYLWHAVAIFLTFHCVCLAWCFRSDVPHVPEPDAHDVARRAVARGELGVPGVGRAARHIPHRASSLGRYAASDVVKCARRVCALPVARSCDLSHIPLRVPRVVLPIGRSART